ncbi:hypothetical protein FN846DRAFT_296904 [Sphaerosporella brunnea]|uniref:Regulator of chromosome condensation 1/beta-lactamase-inhibitor protein II n=1 Tax=Sphaerosporella brunnea TaxID=1250544 RepID=A0A5J5EK92_9PEZI|nr:hypothetical protein FN846DRAFT_296904 [Sphaerosporella brunnea]
MGLLLLLLQGPPHMHSRRYGRITEASMQASFVSYHTVPPWPGTNTVLPSTHTPSSDETDGCLGLFFFPSGGQVHPISVEGRVYTWGLDELRRRGVSSLQTKRLRNCIPAEWLAPSTARVSETQVDVWTYVSSKTSCMPRCHSALHAGHVQDGPNRF